MKTLRSIFAVVFALLVFVSSSSFSFGLHYCGGKVRDVAFLEQADGCGHKDLPPCHRAMMKGCCEDEKVSYEGQGFHNDLAKVHVADNSFITVALPPVLISEVIPSVESTPGKFYNYDPPLRSADLVVVNRILLI